MSVDQQRFEKGLAIRKQLGMHLAPGANSDSAFFAHTVSELFGSLFTRPGLSLRDREMITLAVIIAIGGTEENLSNHFRGVRAVGFTDQEIVEIIVQTMYYAGWPRGAAANQIYNRVKIAAGDAKSTEVPDFQAGNDAERRAAGMKVRKELGMDKFPQPPHLDKKFFDHTVKELFGSLFPRPGLSLRDREVITLSVIMALGGTFENQAGHFRALTDLGLSDDEITEIIIQMMYYAGWPRGAAANQIFNRVRASRVASPSGD